MGNKSEELFEEALKHIPGGVNSPVRAFRGVGGQPFFAERAEDSIPRRFFRRQISRECTSMALVRKFGWCSPQEN